MLVGSARKRLSRHRLFVSFEANILASPSDPRRSYFVAFPLGSIQKNRYLKF